MNASYKEWQENVEQYIDLNNAFGLYNWIFSEGKITIDYNRKLYVAIVGLFLGIFFFSIFYINELNTLWNGVNNNPIFLFGPLFIIVLGYILSGRRIILYTDNIFESKERLQTLTYKHNTRYGGYIIVAKKENKKVFTILEIHGKDEAEEFIKLLKEKIDVTNPEKVETGQFRS